MREDREVVSLFLAERTEKNIPVRQPLGSLSTISQVHYPDIVKSEVNVKEIVSGAKENVLYTDVTEDLRLEGLYREMVRKIQDLRKKEGVSVSDLIDVVYENTEDNKKVMEKFGEELKKKVSAKTLTLGSALNITKSTS
jgi:isoleucyl-tRNA synthetase